MRTATIAPTGGEPTDGRAAAHGCSCRQVQRAVMLLGCAIALASFTAPLPAQRVATVAPLADTTGAMLARKSPKIAGALGLVFPGSGHWYALEGGRGTAVAAVYWLGVALVAGGRTDRVGQVGGVAFLGALSFSVVDGIRAATRFNRRRVPRATPPRRPELTRVPGGSHDLEHLPERARR